MPHYDIISIRGWLTQHVTDLCPTRLQLKLQEYSFCPYIHTAPYMLWIQGQISQNIKFCRIIFMCDMTWRFLVGVWLMYMRDLVWIPPWWHNVYWRVYIQTVFFSNNSCHFKTLKYHTQLSRCLLDVSKGNSRELVALRQKAKTTTGTGRIVACHCGNQPLPLQLASAFLCATTSPLSNCARNR